MTSVSELRRHRELFANLTLRELRGKYKRSALGWGWSLVNPLAQMAIFSLVFGVFFDFDPPRGDPSGLQVFAFFLLCGRTGPVLAQAEVAQFPITSAADRIAVRSPRTYGPPCSNTRGDSHARL